MSSVIVSIHYFLDSLGSIDKSFLLNRCLGVQFHNEYLKLDRATEVMTMQSIINRKIVQP